MKNLPAIALFCAALSACAGLPERAPSESASSAGTLAQKAPEQQAATSAPRRPRLRSASTTASPGERLPAAELSEEVLFRYLSAEIADQRGDWEYAFVNMLQIAQLSRDPRLARRAAEIAINAKETDEALAAVRLWREISPESEEAAQFYLSFTLIGDNLEEARPILEQRLKAASKPTLGATILQTQRLLSRARDKAAAFRLLEDVLADYRALPEMHLALAQAAHAAGDAPRAAAEAREALAISPSSDLAALTLAQVLPDKDAALKSLADYLKANPKSRDVRLAYARFLVEQKQYDAARAEFNVLLKEQPRDLTVLYALGLLSAQRNDLQGAEKYLSTYLEELSAKPDDERDPTQALLILAQIAEQRNDIPAALKWLDQVPEGTPQAYVSAQIKRAQLVGRNGDLDSARKVLHDTRASGQEEELQLIVAEAQMLRTAERGEEGLAVLEEALKRYPDNTDLLYDHAMLAEKLNRLDVMETSLRKIIAIAPRNQNAYNALGYSLAERNIRLEEAYQLISRALDLAPEDPFIMDSMGWVQFRLGRLKEAEELLRRAYSLRPDPEIAVHLGEVLWALGQRDDARKLWREASLKDPKNDTLKNTLGRLRVRL
ncbi:tetratricopeptide repeat protein [Noviherbaspirillum sp. L7-7A]|uniref:tetratricopeptide repeat protein n=1 Tax=Noviherbaspirillum sp. L7-7A TaxID=2850560 RepID=UPI0020122A33|nr:tetratricopeptide repeat protein [Noviherbaspirillum sp. L7-7A]